MRMRLTLPSFAQFASGDQEDEEDDSAAIPSPAPNGERYGDY